MSRALCDSLAQDIEQVESIVLAPRVIMTDAEELQLWRTLTELDRRVGAELDELRLPPSAIHPADDAEQWGPVRGAPGVHEWPRLGIIYWQSATCRFQVPPNWRSEVAALKARIEAKRLTYDPPQVVEPVPQPKNGAADSTGWPADLNLMPIHSGPIWESATALAKRVGQPKTRVESFLRQYRDKFPDCYRDLRKTVDDGARRRNEASIEYRLDAVLDPLQKRVEKWAKVTHE